MGVILIMVLYFTTIVPTTELSADHSIEVTGWKSYKQCELSQGAGERVIKRRWPEAINITTECKYKESR